MSIRSKSLRLGKYQLNPFYVPPVVNKRHQIGNILFSFQQVITDLNALKVQNASDLAVNSKTIESLTQTNQALTDEVNRANTVHTKLSELIAV